MLSSELKKRLAEIKNFASRNRQEVFFHFAANIFMLDTDLKLQTEKKALPQNRKFAPTSAQRQSGVTRQSLCLAKEELIVFTFLSPG